MANDAIKPGVVRLRLIRAGDAPATNPQAFAYEFGLQDTKQVLTPPTRRADGFLVFDFELTVKPGADPSAPVFGGPYASGPPQERFVYLSWRALPTGMWINRIKARLADVDWALIHAAQAAGQPLTADTTGWSPGGGRRRVHWTLG